jgi:hypothetical protein
LRIAGKDWWIGAKTRGGLPAAAGERLLDDVGDPTLEPVKVIASPAVTHVKYRVAR